MIESISTDVISKLLEARDRYKNTVNYIELVKPKDAAVLARFQPIFSAEHIPSITEEEFRSFLLFNNNNHWTGLHRQGPRICADMIKLREALTTLIDETQPIENRLDKAMDMVSGMGKNIATAILIVTHPDKYGVWNNRSEANMKRFDIWPSFQRGDSFGKRYLKINKKLLQLRDVLPIELWLLDALWWYFDKLDAGETVL